MKAFIMPFRELPKDGMIPIDDVHRVFGRHLLVTLDNTHIWFDKGSLVGDPKVGAQLFAYGVFVWSASNISLAPHGEDSPPTYHQPMVIASVRTEQPQSFQFNFHVESGSETSTWNYVIRYGTATLGSFSVGPGPSVLPVDFAVTTSNPAWHQLVLSLEPSDKYWVFRKCEIYE